MSNLLRGKVKFFHNGAGYGFIQYFENDDLREIYTHHSKLKGCKKLKVGQYVRFTIGKNEHGPIAENVEPIFGGDKNA